MALFRVVFLQAFVSLGVFSVGWSFISGSV